MNLFNASSPPGKEGILSVNVNVNVVSLFDVFGFLFLEVVSFFEASGFWL